MNDQAVSSRTSAADAFRSVRGEGREREVPHEVSTSGEARARFQPPFAPISPADSSSSFGRPRVNSSASDRERRHDTDGYRERGHTLPSMRTPRSPAFSNKLNSPAPLSGFPARGPPSQLEGPSLAPMLAPPSGYSPVHKLSPGTHRRQDYDNSILGPTDRSPAPGMHEGAHLPPLPHLPRQEGRPSHHRTDQYPGHGHEPMYPMSAPGSASHSRRPSQPAHAPNQEGELAHPAGVLPLAYSNNNTEPPVPGATGVPGSLSSLGSQAGAVGDRKSAKQQPSFVNKLYSMLEDERIAHMISWAPSGTVFSVANPSVFSKVVLPQWFKHSNWQSFVRQLNMYGFNKVNQTFQGDPIDEIQVWEFRHPRFRRGELHLLNDIKRKNSRQKRAMSPTQSVSGGDYESRREASPTPSPEMSSLSMDEHGRHASDARVRAAELAYMNSGPSAWPGTVPSHTGMPFAHDGGPHHHHTSASMGPGGVPGPHPHSGGPEQEPSFNVSLQDQQHRLNDMSDRIDAIIRHSNYLESQLRTVTERLHQSQQAEQAIALHVTRSLEHLINLGANLSSNGGDARERGRLEETRQSILAACRAEMDFLRPYISMDGPSGPGAPTDHPPQMLPPEQRLPHEAMRALPPPPPLGQHQHPQQQPPPLHPHPPPNPHQNHQHPHSQLLPPPPQSRNIHAVPARSTSLLDRRPSLMSSDNGNALPPPPPSGAPHGYGPPPAHGPPGTYQEGMAYAPYRRESYESDTVPRRG
ncbi:Flocculation suppression protein [Tilletia horrida]|nr:Flocculation suppression protein [Tilletia horrida]